MNTIALNQKEAVRENCLRVAALLVAFFACILLMGTNVYATNITESTKEIEDETKLSDYITEHMGFEGENYYNKDLPSSVYSKLKVSVGSANTSLSTDYTQTTKTVNGTIFYIYYPTKEAKKMVTAINNNAEYNKAQNKVTTLDTQLGLEADTAGASEALSGITPFISLIAGFIVILLTAFMLVFTAIDCVYIAYPVFRNKCEDAKASGNKLMTKTGSDGESKLRWVTDDAQAAIETCTIDSGKNKWAFYLKKRIISYIMLGIVIFMFFTGNITLLIEVAIKAVSGLMNVLKGFGA